MKRSKGQDQGRTPQFGTRKVQTTVRIPEDVLEFLKDHFGIFQRAIDALLIVPIRRVMAEEQELEAAKATDSMLREAAEHISADREKLATNLANEDNGVPCDT